MGIGESDKAIESFKDLYGNPLRNGFYFAGNGRTGDIYNIKLNEESFIVESYEGVIPIHNHKKFAKQLIPLHNPRSNLEFALLHLE